MTLIAPKPGVKVTVPYNRMDCHYTRDWDYFVGPVVPGTLGEGGEAFDRYTGLRKGG